MGMASAEAPKAPVRFDDARSKRRICLGVLAYGAALCLVALIASGAPDIYYKLEGEIRTTDLQPAVYLTKTPVPLVPANQAIFFGEALENPGYPNSVGLRYEQKHLVSLWGSNEDVLCPDAGEDKCRNLVDQAEQSGWARCWTNEEMCGRVELLTVNSIEYSYYHTRIEIQPADVLGVFTGPFIYHHDVLYVNSDYTLKWQLPWSYLYIAFTLVFLLAPRVGLAPRIARVPRENRPWQQKWVHALHWLLILYNYPLLVFQVSSPGASAGLEIFHVVSAMLFVAAVMLFWLALFGSAARASSDTEMMLTSEEVTAPSRAKTFWSFLGRFHVLEAALVTAIYICFVATYSAARVGQSYDSSFGSSDLPAAGGLRNMGFLALVIYMIVLAVQIIRGVRRFLALSPSLKALYLISIFAVIMAVAGLFSGVTRPLQDNPKLVWVWNTQMNLYVWVLGWGFAPNARALRGEFGCGNREEKRDATESYAQEPVDSAVIKSPRRGGDLSEVELRRSPTVAGQVSGGFGSALSPRNAV